MGRLRFVTQRGWPLPAQTVFMGFDDVRRRLDVPAKALLQVAEADGYRLAFNLERRDALRTN